MSYVFDAEKRRNTSFMEHAKQQESKAPRAAEQTSTSINLDDDPVNHLDDVPSVYRSGGKMVRPRQPSLVGKVLASLDLPEGEFIQDSINPEPMPVNLRASRSGRISRTSSEQ